MGFSPNRVTKDSQMYSKTQCAIFLNDGTFILKFWNPDEKELLEDLNLALLKIINIWMDVKHNKLQQESIPVGYVPSAAVVVSWGGVSARRVLLKIINIWMDGCKAQFTTRMHSSRMRTYVRCSGRLLGGGGCLPSGCLPRGCLNRITDRY